MTGTHFLERKTNHVVSVGLNNNTFVYHTPTESRPHIDDLRVA